MIERPLYSERVLAAVELVAPTPLDPACTACPLHKSAKHPCMSADGRPGGLLVVCDSPSQADDASGRPAMGAVGTALRRAVAAVWQGAVIYDNGIRCAHKGAAPPAAYDACRGYLAQIVRKAQPQRILLAGSGATRSLLGRSINTVAVMDGGGCWLDDLDVPVFVLPAPSYAVRSAHARREYEAAVARAINGPLPQRRPYGMTVCTVETPDDARAAASALRRGRWVSYDVETGGAALHWPGHTVLSLAAYAHDDTRAYTWTECALLEEGTAAPLRALLEDPAVLKVGQNLKFDDASVRQALGWEVRGVHADTRLWRKLLRADTPSTSLETLTELVGMGGHKDEAQAIVAAAKKAMAKADAARGVPRLANYGAVAYEALPPDVLARYNAMDVVSTSRVAARLSADMDAEPDIRATWERLVGGASWAVGHIEAWGMPVSRAHLVTLSAHLAAKAASAQAELDALAWPGFNANSHPQMGKFLWTHEPGCLGLKPLRRTKSGAASSDGSVLEVLLTKPGRVGRFAQAVTDYRSAVKLRSTYAEGMLQHIAPDGRVHPSINLDGAASGRPSCTDPNLYNIPRADTDDGKAIRTAFEAEPGWVIVSLDYSQLEVRIAAYLAGDEVMAASFRSGEDIHLQTAMAIGPMVWGMTAEQVAAEVASGNKVKRTAAKGVVFGVLYGKEAEHLAHDLGCTVREAQVVMDAVMGRFRALKAWIEARRAYTVQTGVTWTYWDGKRARRRPLPDVGAHGFAEQQKNAERAAWNTPIQGTASDYCTASMVALTEWILESGAPARLCTTVYDAIVLEVRKDALVAVARKASSIMRSWPSGNVPLEVDVEVGKSWGALEKFQLPDETGTPSANGWAQGGEV